MVVGAANMLKNSIDRHMWHIIVHVVSIDKQTPYLTTAIKADVGWQTRNNASSAFMNE